MTDSIEQFGEEHEFTKLIPDLKGKDPDDAFSSVPYEKGSVFLYHLERLVGKESWDQFIPYYFETFRGKSVDSYDFKSTLLAFFSADASASQKLQDLDWDSWFYSPGYPPKPHFDTTLADECYALASKWRSLLDGKTSDFTPHPSDIDSFTANQSVIFLEAVQSFPSPPTPHLVDLMGRTYAFSTSHNVELVSRFYVIGLQARAEGVYEPAAALLGKVGRMKFVRPVFRELMRCDLSLAKKTLRGNREFWHPICRGMVEKMLERFEREAEAEAEGK